MPRSEDLLFAPSKWVIVAAGTNTNVNALQAAPAGKQRLYVVGISISATAAPTAAEPLLVILSAQGGTTLDQFYIPQAAFAPIVINYVRPLEVPQGQSVNLFLPALGAGVIGSAVMRGFTTTP